MSPTQWQNIHFFLIYILILVDWKRLPSEFSNYILNLELDQLCPS